MNIKILGIGCSKCKVLYENTEKAIAELGLDATLVKEEDIVNILKYNTLSLPALVIDEKVVSSGHILSTSQVKDLLTKK